VLAALVVAGGVGSRMGLDRPKQFALLGGVPILVHTLRTLCSYAPGLDAIQLVMHPDWHSHTAHLLDTYLPGEGARIQLSRGGATRTESVENGLHALADRLNDRGDDTAHCLVAIQDGVRPFLNHRLLADSYASAQQHGSGVCAVPVKSSLRLRTPGGSQAVDRSLYYAVQTPQTFRLDLIRKAYAQRNTAPTQPYTDDASVLEAHGTPVHLCAGDYDNLKITSPADIEVGEMILKREQVRKDN